MGFFEELFLSDSEYKLYRADQKAKLYVLSECPRQSGYVQEI